MFDCVHDVMGKSRGMLANVRSEARQPTCISHCPVVVLCPHLAHARRRGLRSQ